MGAPGRRAVLVPRSRSGARRYHTRVRDRDPATDRPAVLVVHNRYREPGGEDVVVAAETALLAAHGHRVEQLIVDNRDLDASGLRGRLRLATRTVWSHDAARRVADAATAMSADVVHVHNFLPQLSPSIHGAARATGAAVVQTLHNYRLICPAATLFREGRPCQDCRSLPIAIPAVVHACYRGSRAETAVVVAMLAVHRTRHTWARDVDAFVALTPFSADRLSAGGIPRARIAIKPNFTEAPAARPDLPRSGFLFAGRLSEEKGIGVLLEAWRRANVPTTLRIAGDGPLADVVEAAARADPRIEPLGRLDAEALGSEMRRARALAFPSVWFEGLPMTIIEAFANRLPVIAFGQGSMPDVVEHDRTGLLAKPGSADDFAGALRQLDGDAALAARLGADAAVVHQARYTPDVNHGLLLAVYDRAIAHRNREVVRAGT